MKSFQSWLVIVLLAAILTTQILIIVRMPASPQRIPTVADFTSAESDSAKKELSKSIPVVRGL